MQQVRTRFVMATTLMAFILVTCCAVVPAFGQTQPWHIKIPYTFTVGSNVLQPGTYNLTLSNTSITVQSTTGTGGAAIAVIVARIGGPAELVRNGSVVFDKTDTGRILSEVWVPGSDGVLVHAIPASHTRDYLLISELSETRTVAGKTAYNLTCGRCHGPNGTGDAGADKFFNFPIPRLTSAEVQGKSDEELKTIINQGTSVMPPVEVDEAGFRHRLPSQDVAAVIAYIRTLKK